MQKHGGFFQKKIDFFRKIAEPSKLAMKRDWKNKTSQKVQILVTIIKKFGFFEKKIDFVEIAWVKNFVVGCNWNSKNSQNFQKMVLVVKINVFFEKKLCIFLKNR